MSVLIVSLFLILSFVTSTVSSSSSNSRKSLTHSKIVSVNASCDLKFFNITMQMEKPFKGVLFAREFSQKCRTFGNFSDSLILNIPTSSCGISSGRDEHSQKMYYTLTVVLQQDRFLRQISDESKKLRCYVTEETFQVKSKNMELALKNLIYNVNHRKGRMKTERINKAKAETSHVIDSTLVDALKAARAWMEITPTRQNEDDILKVGESALLVVKSTLPVGIGWRVVDCLAHDGLGESSQKLMDEDGCPVDELLLPALLKKPAKPIALMKHQEAVSKFVAFKFPDRDRLHLSCGLQLCRNTCPQVDCLNRNHTVTKDARLGRTLSEGVTGDILDRLEVFNSIEVRAPEIELQDDYINFETNYGEYVTPFGNIPGDRTFCVSPSNMALSFCMVGFVFLCAVFMAVWSLLRSRRTTANIPYYTKSLFSSSAYSGCGGSKLLLQESPYVSHRSRSMNSYGRIF